MQECSKVTSLRAIREYNKSPQYAKTHSVMAVLTLLGFRGAKDFNNQVGMGINQCGKLLYAPKVVQKTSDAFPRMLECLISRYLEKKNVLKQPERKFIVAWIKNWTTQIKKLYGSTVGKNVDPKSISRPSVRRSYRRRNYRADELDKFVARWLDILEEKPPAIVEVERKF
jgi:hypothetical protein